MQSRMKNPAMVITAAMQPVQALWAAAQMGGVPARTLSLVHLRASQINGCSVCVDSGSCHAKKAGETDERLFAVAAWRDSPNTPEASFELPGPASATPPDGRITANCAKRCHNSSVIKGANGCSSRNS